MTGASGRRSGNGVEAIGGGGEPGSQTVLETHPKFCVIVPLRQDGPCTRPGAWVHPARMPIDTHRPDRPTAGAMMNAALGRCPNCKQGRLYRQYLKVADQCPRCGEELHHHRADDAPPYFTIFIVGHLLVPMVLWTEKAWKPELYVHFSLWLPLAVIMTLTLLPVVKGAVVGLQWALYMHGFEVTARRGNEEAGSEPGSVRRSWTTS